MKVKVFKIFQKNVNHAQRTGLLKILGTELICISFHCFVFPDSFSVRTAFRTVNIEVVLEILPNFFE